MSDPRVPVPATLVDFNRMRSDFTIKVSIERLKDEGISVELGDALGLIDEDGDVIQGVVVEVGAFTLTVQAAPSALGVVNWVSEDGLVALTCADLVSTPTLGGRPMVPLATIRH